ncbi:MAG: alpha/beta fold hydrolase [Planctomycetota bacterium]|jgi:pimeloyl-ACP methyl ester carboxylesterase
MAPRSIYRSETGKAQDLAAYDRANAGLGVPFEERTFETRFGTTHALLLGPPDGPPLLSLHGGNAFNADTLAWFLPLAETHRIYAPDTIGHPGRSAETRLSSRDLSYGEWAADVLDGFSLERSAAVGASFGAGILLRLASVAPERITRAAFVVPSGVVNPPLWPMLSKLVWPLLMYKLRPGRERARRLLQPLFGRAPVEDRQLDRSEVVFRHYRTIREMPRPATAAELERFTAPVLVLAGELDMMFPARWVLPRVREIFRGPVSAAQLDGSAHFPNAEARKHIVDRMRTFLEAGEGEP